ncbi:MAG: microcin ABC transporter permease, partial [Deltaproteobacteria bacterium]|nr:microcin ABC transporter permease [Deltaproteobacteria bacterium]
MGGLTSYFIRRFLLIIPTFLGITMIFFFILQIVPGGPLELEIMKLRAGAAALGRGPGSSGPEVSGGSTSGLGATEIPAEAMQEMKKFYGMDKPIVMRYLHWLF